MEIKTFGELCLRDTLYFKDRYNCCSTTVIKIEEDENDNSLICVKR